MGCLHPRSNSKLNNPLLILFKRGRGLTQLTLESDFEGYILGFAETPGRSRHEIAVYVAHLVDRSGRTSISRTGRRRSSGDESLREVSNSSKCILYAFLFS